MHWNQCIFNLLRLQLWKFLQYFKVWQFDFDEWPSNHTDEGTYIRPYNGSLFTLRNCYKQIFHEKKLDKIDEENEDSGKVFKVIYKVNLLPQLGIHYSNHKYQENKGKLKLIKPERLIMKMFAETDYMDIYNTDSVQRLI